MHKPFVWAALSARTKNTTAKLLKAKDVQVEVDLSGTKSFNFQASDLGHEYVSLNSDYRS